MGDWIGHYRLRAKLGSGGMGAVFLAQDERLDRPVAIKRLLDSLAKGQAAGRLLIAAHATARLDHANTCRIYEGSVASGPLH